MKGLSVAALIGTLWGLLVLTGCTSLTGKIEKPRVTLVNVEAVDVQLLEQRFAVTLRVQNPNDVELPIKGLSFALEINGRDFAHGVSQQEVTVPSFGEALLDLEVVSSLANVLDQLRGLEAEQSDLTYKFWGRLSLSRYAASIPFDQEGSLYLGGGKSAVMRAN